MPNLTTLLLLSNQMLYINQYSTGLQLTFFLLLSSVFSKLTYQQQLYDSMSNLTNRNTTNSIEPLERTDYITEGAKELHHEFTQKEKRKGTISSSDFN